MSVSPCAQVVGRWSLLVLVLVSPITATTTPNSTSISTSTSTSTLRVGRRRGGQKGAGSHSSVTPHVPVDFCFW